MKKKETPQPTPVSPPRRLTVFIASPVYGDPTAPYADAIEKIIMEASNQRCPVTFMRLAHYECADHYKSYNALTQKFRATKADFVIYIDSDMTPTLKDLLMLISRGKKAIGALYVKRRLSDVAEYVLQTLDGEPFDPRVSEVQEVKAIGAGCTLYHRSLFDAIEKKHPELRYRQSREEGGQICVDFFHRHIDNMELVSGDFALSRLVRETGEKVYVDCETKVGHWGRYKFMPPQYKI